MTSDRDRKVALYLAIALLILGFLSYAAFPAKPTGEPVRLMFSSAAGSVLFSHKTHATADGYGLACYDCHHHPPEEDVEIIACGSCHLNPERDAEDAHSCFDCHDAETIDPASTPKRVDAFHDQCIGCHAAYGEGPVECNDCHVQ